MNRGDSNSNQKQQGGFLFENVGRKLKTIVGIFFAIQIVFYFLVAVVVGVISGSPGLLVIALLSAAFLSFSSWIICIVLYGYGEMIDGIAEIAKNTRTSMFHQEEKSMPKKANFENQTNQKNVTSEPQKQSKDNMENTAEPFAEEETKNCITFNCPYCERELSVFEEKINESICCPYCGQNIK